MAAGLLIYFLYSRQRSKLRTLNDACYLPNAQIVISLGALSLFLGISCIGVIFLYFNVLILLILAMIGFYLGVLGIVLNTQDKNSCSSESIKLTEEAKFDFNLGRNFNLLGTFLCLISLVYLIFRILQFTSIFG
jgi:hypothetical protein